MDNNLQIFNNNEFGQVRTIEVDGQVYFVAIDIARALGYKDATNAIKQHCRWVVKRHIPHPQSKDKEIEVNVIPIGDIYRLVSNSELPSSEKFESWVFDEVIPTIHKTGSYKMPKSKAEPKQTLSATNTAIKLIIKTLESAGVSPQYIAVAVKNAYKPVGIDVPLNGITMENKFYDAATIAERLAVMSKNNKPHAQAISAIISELNIIESERQLVPFMNNGHSGTTYQYSDSVIENVNQWIKERNYPTMIKVNDRNYIVNYSRK